MPFRPSPGRRRSRPVVPEMERMRCPHVTCGEELLEGYSCSLYRHSGYCLRRRYFRPSPLVAECRMVEQDTLQEGGMDVLVMLEERPDHSPVLAHVNSVPSPLTSERPARDIVTLYGVPSAESLALALAAAVESHRTGQG